MPWRGRRAVSSGAGGDQHGLGACPALLGNHGGSASDFGVDAAHVAMFEDLCVAPGAARRLQQAHETLLASERVRYTPNTLTDVDAWMQQVRESRERGFAYCNEEYYWGGLALAVPVYDLSKRVVAGLQLSVSASKWTVRRALSRFIPLMQDTARLISTTPPMPRALVPFGGGAARDLHATSPGSQG